MKTQVFLISVFVMLLFIAAPLAFASSGIPLEKFPVDHVPKDTLATLSGVSCSECVGGPPPVGGGEPPGK